MSAIKINNLVKRWGGFTAVDDISFEMGEAEFVALLGPSGCASASRHMTRLQDKHAATLQTTSLHLSATSSGSIHTWFQSPTQSSKMPASCATAGCARPSAAPRGGAQPRRCSLPAPLDFGELAR